MQISQLPDKFPIRFGESAGSGYIQKQIPLLSQAGVGDGARASLADAFPPNTFLPVGSGGVPPYGQDANGILYMLSAWARWASAGGNVYFDSTFSAAIGGYPTSAVVASKVTQGRLWISTADNNTTDPDSAQAANWIGIALKSELTAAVSAVTPAGTIVTNGWWRDPNTGFTIEWGRNSVVSMYGAVAITLPRAMTTLFSIIASDNGASTWSSANATFNGISDPSTTGFTAQCATWNGSAVTRNVTVNFGWHAFGLS